MKLRILGCSGGIGGSLRTTSMLLDEDILIDAGTGVGDLSIAELAKIDHVFVTHSHLDHVCSIPFLVDTVGHKRNQPLIVHAAAPTLDALRSYVFNNYIWPDFSVLPSAAAPFMRYSEVKIGEAVELGGRKITALPANHVVPAVGYQIDSGVASLVFSGDTTVNDEFWDVVNRIENLRHLIIETAFCESEKYLAIASKHLCPSLLAGELAKLQRPVEIYITHIKPGEMEQTMREIGSIVRAYQPQMLEQGQEFKL